MVNVRTHHVSEAAFGPLSLQDVELAALEGPVFESHTIAGLAGVDLFADRTVWWDLERYSVSLTPGGEAPVSDPCWQLVDSEWMRPWRVMVPVVIDGISGMAMLDTGAQKSVINNAFATAIGGERAIADEGITGIDGRSIDLMLVKVARASIGPWQWEQPPLQTAELAVFDRMGAPTNNFMLLGMDWLRGHRFVQDYRQQKVWLAVPGSSA